MNINDNFEFLNIGLPEDILRRKNWGDFEGAVRLIDKRLAGDIPDALRACLICEREMILRLENDYPFSEAQAIEKIQSAIPDFTEAEFHEMVDNNKIDWIYVHGEPHYFLRFYQTLIKTDAAFAARAGVADRGRVDGEDSDTAQESLLDRAARLMRENGKLSNRIRIRASVRIKDEYFEKGKRVRVHIPIPAACIQQSEIKLVGFSSEPTYIAPEDAPQRTVYWEEVMQENHPFWVEYSYVHTAPYVDPMKIVPDAEQPTFFTNEENPHIVFTPYIKELVKTLTKGVTNPVEKARIFYDFVTLNVKYSFMREYFGLENIAENCARNFKGDCGVQALLFITLCRCAGIPARWQSGLCAEPGDVGMHDWAMFYVAPYGWMFADPSFGGGGHRAGNEARRVHYFGNLDPYRMVANCEFRAPLDPPKTHWRHDPYDNQAGEIEYEDRGLRGPEYERDMEMTEYTEL